MQKTNINWCTHTWNPIVGCSPCSPGCENCYAKALHDKRHAASYTALLPVQYDKPFHEIQFFSERLTDPIRARKPCTVFVCSMGDLFHESVPFDWINRVICAMALTPRHRYMILTKRPERMMNYFIDLDRNRIWLCLSGIIGNECFHKGGSVLPHGGAEDSDWWGEEDFPLPNLWLGVTVCNQAEADEKIPILLATPAAHRFVSIEPMLGPIDLDIDNALYERRDNNGNCWQSKGLLDLVILGGETGKNARAMYPDWVRSVRDQCAAAGVPFHFKGWGKSAPGRLLDGVEHNGAKEVTR
jgi:protein gp37